MSYANYCPTWIASSLSPLYPSSLSVTSHPLTKLPISFSFLNATITLLCAVPQRYRRECWHGGIRPSSTSPFSYGGSTVAQQMIVPWSCPSPSPFSRPVSNSVSYDFLRDVLTNALLWICTPLNRCTCILASHDIRRRQPLWYYLRLPETSHPEPTFMDSATSTPSMPSEKYHRINHLHVNTSGVARITSWLRTHRVDGSLIASLRYTSGTCHVRVRPSCPLLLGHKRRYLTVIWGHMLRGVFVDSCVASFCRRRHMSSRALSDPGWLSAIVIWTIKRYRVGPK